MSGYIGSTPVPQATQHREAFTATEGQTSFATAGYTPLFLAVYLNGSHLSPADFVATNGSDVVLVVAASADDICDIISYSPFEVNSQAFTGDFTVDGTTLVVDSTNNRVGINEASPTAPLHIKANDNADLLRFTVNGNEVWAFKGASVSAPTSGNDTVSFGIAGGNQAMAWDELGICTTPLQPAFSVFNSALNNIQVATGETVVPFNRESFDRNGNFNSSNYTFTAPVQGTYQLDGQFRMRGLQNDINYIYFNLITTNASVANIFEYSGADDADYHTVQVSLLANMAATHTAVLKVYQSGGAAETDLEQDTSIFSGYLVG